MSRRRAGWASALLLLSLTGCGDTPSGAKAYREGRYAEALASFDAAMEREGDRATPVLLYDRALAALHVGDLEKAEGSARALAGKGTELEARRDFVLANVAFARSVQVEAASARGPEPAAGLDRALVLVEDALASWRRAAVDPSMGPEARRNVERGLLRWDSLRKAKSDSAPGRDPKAPPVGPSPAPGKEPKPAPEAPPPPPPSSLPQPTGGDPAVATVTTELPATEVMRLLEVLAEKEKQKVTLRRARRIERAATVEKDW